MEGHTLRSAISNPAANHPFHVSSRYKSAAGQAFVWLQRPTAGERAAARGQRRHVPCTFDESLVVRLDRGRLPENWRSHPAPPELQLIGDEWVKSGQSAVLEVPSAVIETDSNYLLSPQHPDFPKIRIGDPRPFYFDLRLLDAGPTRSDERVTGVPAALATTRRHDEIILSCPVS